MRVLGFFGESLRGERRIHEGFPSKDLQDYWSTRPKYEPASVAGSSTAGGDGASDPAYQAWLQAQRKEKEDEPPPPEYTMEYTPVTPSTSIQRPPATTQAIPATTHATPAPTQIQPHLPNTDPAVSSLADTLSQTTISHRLDTVSPPLPPRNSSLAQPPQVSSLEPTLEGVGGFAPPPRHPSQPARNPSYQGRWNSTQPPRTNPPAPVPPSNTAAGQQWPPEDWQSPGAASSSSSVPFFPEAKVPSFPSQPTSPAPNASGLSFPSGPHGASRPPYPQGQSNPATSFEPQSHSTLSAYPGQIAHTHTPPGTPGHSHGYAPTAPPISQYPGQNFHSPPSQPGTPGHSPGYQAGVPPPSQYTGASTGQYIGQPIHSPPPPGTPGYPSGYPPAAPPVAQYSGPSSAGQYHGQTIHSPPPPGTPGHAPPVSPYPGASSQYPSDPHSLSQPPYPLPGSDSYGRPQSVSSHHEPERVNSPYSSPTPAQGPGLYSSGMPHSVHQASSSYSAGPPPASNYVTGPHAGPQRPHSTANNQDAIPEYMTPNPHDLAYGNNSSPQSNPYTSTNYSGTPAPAAYGGGGPSYFPGSGPAEPYPPPSPHSSSIPRPPTGPPPLPHSTRPQQTSPYPSAYPGHPSSPPPGQYSPQYISPQGHESYPSYDHQQPSLPPRTLLTSPVN